MSNTRKNSSHSRVSVRQGHANLRKDTRSEDRIAPGNIHTTIHRYLSTSTSQIISEGNVEEKENDDRQVTGERGGEGRW